jgi:hypothetical protein
MKKYVKTEGKNKKISVETFHPPSKENSYAILEKDKRRAVHFLR